MTEDKTDRLLRNVEKRVWDNFSSIASSRKLLQAELFKELVTHYQLKNQGLRTHTYNAKEIIFQETDSFYCYQGCIEVNEEQQRLEIVQYPASFYVQSNPKIIFYHKNAADAELIAIEVLF